MAPLSFVWKKNHEKKKEKKRQQQQQHGGAENLATGSSSSQNNTPSPPTTTPPQNSSDIPLPQEAKSLPRNYFDCPNSDLIILVSYMLQELVSLNDALPFDPNQLTRFHSRAPPGISIYDYLVRIVKFCTLEKSILLSMIYYIDLLCTTYKTFNINSLTVHRFLITAAMVGSKGLCDTFCTNSHYAKVGGLSRAELNLLEVEFLVRVDYKIVPQSHLLDEYYYKMVTRSDNVYVFDESTSATAAAAAGVEEGEAIGKNTPVAAADSKLLQPPPPQSPSASPAHSASSRKRPSVVADVIPSAAALATEETQVRYPDPPGTPKRIKHSPTESTR